MDTAIFVVLVLIFLQGIQRDRHLRAVCQNQDTIARLLNRKIEKVK